MATRSKIRSKDFDEKVFSKHEYKQMLRRIKEGFPLMTNKNLVDTVFSLGKLHHKGHHKSISDLDKYGDLKFF